MKSLQTLLLLSLSYAGTLIAQEQIGPPESVAFHYFGKVVDQNGFPIEGASVDFYLFKFAATNIVVQTDASGHFDLNEEGITFDISARKDGFWPSEQKTYTMASYPGIVIKPMPTPAQREVFVLKARNPAPELIEVTTRYRPITINGDPISIDLDDPRNPSPSPTASDMIIGITGTPDAKDSEGRFDWQFSVAIPNGGLVPREEKDWVAPISGYLSPLVVRFDKSDEKWSAAETRYFFIKYGAVYGRIGLTVIADDRITPSARISSGFFDPHGGRNLER